MNNAITSRLTSENVLEIQINRPEKKNALTALMYGHLADKLRDAQDERDIHVVVLTGTPGIFCAGSDIANFIENPPLDENAPVWRYFSALMALEKPLLAAVDGAAVGSGASTLLHCDMVYGTSRTVLSFPFTGVGLTPEGASSFLLPLYLGRLRASALLLAGEKLTADKALHFGLLNDIIDPEQLLPHVRQKALALAKLPTDTLKKSKRLMAMGLQHMVAEQFTEEKITTADAIHDRPAQQFFRAFLNRRNF